MATEPPDDASRLTPHRPPGPPVSEMSWSGLIECARDGLSALRQSAEYARSAGFKEKHDVLTGCISEITVRLAAIGCLPLPGEPSFTLLGRDPQAADRVTDWIEERRRADPSARGQEKVAKAEVIRDGMIAWRDSRPALLQGSPGPSGTAGEAKPSAEKT